MFNKYFMFYLDRSRQQQDQYANYDMILDESPRGERESCRNATNCRPKRPESSRQTCHFADEVARLMRDYKQNEQLVRNLGSRYYQVIYPVQVTYFVDIVVAV
jgi:hypothetical protein